jgi:predicted RNA binding protein YcfA (HicA-like mRNA interferase family)
MNLTAKFLVKVLEKHGFVFKRSKGSHQVYYNSATGKTVIVPMHGSKDMPKGTFYGILKQAGIEKTDL